MPKRTFTAEQLSVIRRQQAEWLQRNKDWYYEKRNATRRERYATDAEYRRKRIQSAQMAKAA